MSFPPPTRLHPFLALLLFLAVGCGEGGGAETPAGDATRPTASTATQAEWEAIDAELIALETELADLRDQQRAELGRVLERAERLGAAIDALKRREGVEVVARPALPEVPDETSDAATPTLAEDGSIVAAADDPIDGDEEEANRLARLFILAILAVVMLLALRYGLGRWLAGEDGEDEPDRRIETDEGEIRIAPEVERGQHPPPPDSPS